MTCAWHRLVNFLYLEWWDIQSHQPKQVCPTTLHPVVSMALFRQTQPLCGCLDSHLSLTCEIVILCSQIVNIHNKHSEDIKVCLSITHQQVFCYITLQLRLVCSRLLRSCMCVSTWFVSSVSYFFCSVLLISPFLQTPSLQLPYLN